LQFNSRGITTAGVPVPGQIDEIQTRATRSADTCEVDAVNVGQPRLARRRARSRDRAASERVDQARLADVGSAGQRHLRQAVVRDVARTHGADDEIGR
jgi:hypothetical protein